MEKSVGIIGASGLIGTELASAFETQGWRVIRISRSPRVIGNQQWAGVKQDSLRGLDVLINLAGEPVDKRWTDKNKRRFHKSRVGLTATLAEWLINIPEEERPKLWMNASAVGIYGDAGDTPLTESSPPATDYLSDLCVQWEAAAHALEIPNCRIIHPRIGVVFGKKAHAWEKMKVPFSLGLGGKLGSGQQWFPWVHLQDVVHSLIFLAQHPTAEGPFNIVAPESVRNTHFTKSLGKAFSRPTFCTVPRFVLKLMLGEFSSALLASQHVVPEALEKAGYEWEFADINEALTDLLSEL